MTKWILLGFLPSKTIKSPFVEPCNPGGRLLTSWAAQTILQVFIWLPSHCLVSQSIKWYSSASPGDEEELYDSGSLIKSCSPDTKTDYNTEFSQPLSSPVVWKLQVEYCSQLRPGNSNQFQSQAGQKSAYAGLNLTSLQFVYVCGGHGGGTQQPLWQQ